MSRQVYGDVNNQTNLRNVFLAIHKDAREAPDRTALTDLYQRAGYLISLSHASSWEEKFGDDITEMRELDEQELAPTAPVINRRADDIGTDYDDETWGN